MPMSRKITIMRAWYTFHIMTVVEPGADPETKATSTNNHAQNGTPDGYRNGSIITPLAVSLKEAVRAVYASYEDSSDTIVCDPELIADFTDKVNAYPGIGARYPQKEVAFCLIRTRKNDKLETGHGRRKR